MKKLSLLVAIAAVFSLTACGDDKQTTVVHHTHVVHHNQSADQVNVPTDNGPDNFQAVERPSTYSR